WDSRRRHCQRLAGHFRRAQRAHHGNQGADLRHSSGAASSRQSGARRAARKDEGGSMSATTAFLTDSTLCIGCKACEVACKEWNDLGDDGLNWTGFSYDNTEAVGHSTWRHVKFVEHPPEIGHGGNSPDVASWTFSSDVCKHCENAGCLEACPTGS